MDCEGDLGTLRCSHFFINYIWYIIPLDFVNNSSLVYYTKDF